MSKIKIFLTAVIITLIATTGISTFAWADDTTPVAPNPAETAIPLSETVNAGDSVDLSGIEYTITVAPKSYDNAADKGVGVYNGINVKGGSPIVVKPAEDGRSWTGSVTLADLFGAAMSFGHAGLYEYTITQTHASGSADDTTKWEYDEPEYMLQVLVQNDDETLAYTGWTLSKLNTDTNAYEKVNSGVADQNGSAAFSSTYKATSTLNVTKKVDGAYANKQHPFEQTITLILPEYAAKAVITAEGGSEGRWDPDPLPDVGAITRTYTVKLKHDDTVTFSGVPVGTRYQIAESVNANGKVVDSSGLEYAPKIDWDVDDGRPNVSVPESLSGITGEQLKALSDALRSGEVAAAEFNELLGQKVTVVLADDSEATATLVDASQANGLTFQLSSLGNYAMNSSYTSNDGWKGSTMRTLLNSGSLFDEKLSSLKVSGEAITPVEKTVYSLDYNYGAGLLVQESTGNKFWLPSVSEVYGDWSSWNAYCAQELEKAPQFGLFAKAEITIDNYSSLPGLTSTSWWWLRSADPDSDYNFLYADCDGCYINFANIAGGVLPCFCL